MNIKIKQHMHGRCSFLFFMLLAANCRCQQTLHSPVLTPTSSAYEFDVQDIRGIAINPASLACLGEAQIAVGSERKYLLNELAFYSVSAGLPSRYGNLGLTGDYYGSGLYNESRFSLVYARKLGDHIALGASFNYHSIKLAGYGKNFALGTGTGLLIRLPEKLVIGLGVSNPVGGKFGSKKVEKLPFACRFGLGYTFSTACFISAEMIKEEGQPVNGQLSLCYHFVKQCLARLGINTAYTAMSTGVGFSWNNLSVELGMSYHLQLGVTPGMTLLYKFKEQLE